MKIVAIDSSSLVASVAVVTEETVLGEYTVNFKKTHSQTLLPMLDEVVRMIELDMSQIDAIAVSAGPGSFTGLRIGSATAKGLGLALDKPLIGIPTLDGLAYQMYGFNGLVCPMMDARRNQVYTGLYEFVQDSLVSVMEQKAVSIEEIIEDINGLNRSVIFLGDGVPVHKHVLIDRLTVSYSFAPAHRSRQSAAAVGALAVEYFKQGKLELAKDHEPEYLRQSQAEREREERLQQQ